MWASNNSQVTIRPVSGETIDELGAALAALAADLRDPYNAPTPTLAAALLGPDAFALAHLAHVNSKNIGAVFATPVLSTNIGGPGVFVSDLSVAPAHHGQMLGRDLLAAAAREGSARWGATILKLSVYKDNPRAMTFYQKLGFTLSTRDLSATLKGTPLVGLTAGTQL